MDPNIEIQAAVEFEYQYLKNYGNVLACFRIATVEDAIASTCHVPIESRKILGLYLHKNGDTFSNTFCSAIQSNKIGEILERSFYFLGLDISNTGYCNLLANSLRSQLGITELHSLVTEGCSAFLIIFAIAGEACVASILKGNYQNCRSICTALNEVEICFNTEKENETQLEMLSPNTPDHLGSLQYQQMMCNLLGDRNYDRFEPNEHQLLKSKIGYAMFGPPIEQNGYDRKQQLKIDGTYNQILECNNEFSEYEDLVVISVIFNCLEPLPAEKISRSKKFSDYNPMNDLVPLPIFVLRKCVKETDYINACRVFIDVDNRVYNSWTNYIENNKHNKGIMILPKDGRYIQNDEGVVMVEKHFTPSCGIKENLLTVADIGTSALGITAGAVAGVALIPAVTIAPVVLVGAAVTAAGAGVYSIVRSAIGIHDRKKHKQSMSFTNSEARGAYLNIVAGSLGFLGVGASTALSQMAMRGVNITKGAQYAVNAINGLNITVSGVSVGNTTYQIASDYIIEDKKPSALTVLQLTTSVLFFANAVYSFKSAATITEEAQVNTLQKYQDSLRSNRHRKTFNKMLKETIRQNNGNKTFAQSEVIKACRRIPDKDTVFAVLTRNNKLFNKDGIRFFAEEGQIKLNGVAVDLIEFGELPMSQRSEYLLNVPANYETLKVYESTSTSIGFNESFTVDHLLMIGKYAKLIIDCSSLKDILLQLLKDFSELVRQKLLRILEAVLDILIKPFPELHLIIKRYFHYDINEPMEMILKLVIEYIDMTQENESNTEDNGEDISSNSTRVRYLKYISRGVNMVVSARGINHHLLLKIVNYIYNTIVQRLFEYCVAQESSIQRNNPGVPTFCSICRGHNYAH